VLCDFFDEVGADAALGYTGCEDDFALDDVGVIVGDGGRECVLAVVGER
jgi:hypothetical protein